MDQDDRLSERFANALVAAFNFHRGQPRKGTEIPYISHLLAVTAIVLENGGSEDEAIAALLHDAIEDAGGADARERIRQAFGEEVVEIVDACSDTDEDPKPPWRERKEAYLAHLAKPDVAESVLRVSLADKLHNAQSILRDYRHVGDELWERFNTASRDDQLWYYGRLAEVFNERDNPPDGAEELDGVVSQLEATVFGFTRIVCRLDEIDADRAFVTPGGSSILLGEHLFGPCVYLTESAMLNVLDDQGAGLSLSEGEAVAYCFHSETSRNDYLTRYVERERDDRLVDGYLKEEMWELYVVSAPGPASRDDFEIAYVDALDAIRALPCPECESVAWPTITKPSGAEWLDDPSPSFSCRECGRYLADPFAYPKIRLPTDRYPFEGVVDRSKQPPLPRVAGASDD